MQPQSRVRLLATHSSSQHCYAIMAGATNVIKLPLVPGQESDSENENVTMTFEWTIVTDNPALSFPRESRRGHFASMPPAKRAKFVGARQTTMGLFRAIDEDDWKPLEGVNTPWCGLRYMKELVAGHLDDGTYEEGVALGPLVFKDVPGRFFFMADDAAPDPWRHTKQSYALFGVGKKHAQPFIGVRNVMPRDASAAPNSSGVSSSSGAAPSSGAASSSV